MEQNRRLVEMMRKSLNDLIEDSLTTIEVILQGQAQMGERRGAKLARLEALLGINSSEQDQDKEYIEISPMEGPLFDTCCEEYEDFDDEEAIEDVLVEKPALGTPDCEQYMKKPKINGRDECMKIMGDSSIVPEYDHIDFVVGDAIFEEGARMKKRRELHNYVEGFHQNGVSTIHGRIVLKKGGMIQFSLPQQFRSKAQKNGADWRSKFYKDSRSNLLQERGNDAISTSTIFNSRGPKMKIRIRRFKNQLGAYLMD
ncbi:unnamed protein product [Linum trigynum]|uniref:Uncharacterized protein n=1 Tax=Linum trigynum TaxID=586398 RepID=A0AAV2FX58_9ROSI